VLEVLDHLQITLLAVKVQVLFLALLRLQVAAEVAHTVAARLLLAVLAVVADGKEDQAIMAAQELLVRGMLAVTLILLEIFKVVRAAAAQVQRD